jgi:hypothetical protein
MIPITCSATNGAPGRQLLHRPSILCANQRCGEASRVMRGASETSKNSDAYNVVKR